MRIRFLHRRLRIVNYLYRKTGVRKSRVSSPYIQEKMPLFVNANDGCSLSYTLWYIAIGSL